MSMNVGNSAVFVGRVAKTITLTGDVAKIVLLRNEYAGKDVSGEAKERMVGLQFTAFGKQAEVLAKNSKKGDQLVLSYRVENNDYVDAKAVERFGHNFIVTSFEFGAKGPAHNIENEG